MSRAAAFILQLSLCSSALIACDPAPESPISSSPRLPAAQLATADSPFEPLPKSEDLDLDPVKVALGERLFHDPALSGDGQRSCASCHDLLAGGVAPGEQRSNHPINETGPYNVPTVFNVGFNFRYNWQGKFETLEAHVGGAMMNSRVMGVASWEELVTTLTPIYTQAFRQAGFRDGVTEASVREVLATYQRSLVTPNSRFDQMLRGELTLSEEEARGFELFRSVGCVSCHQGINLGGNMFQRFGVVESAFDRPVTELDQGRMLLTQDPEDAHVFRVPSLRNVALTPPYFHDGSSSTLEDAVQRMARVQLGYALTDPQVRELVAFLNTLTGEYKGQPLAAPSP